LATQSNDIPGCFRPDAGGRLIGETWLPKADLGSEEFQLHLRTLAEECDRYEHQLTGGDFE
jgi:hypothetical protein